MSDLNKVLIEGRLTRNPELRKTPSGVSLCDIAFANNVRYKGKTKTTILIATVWNKQAEALAKLLHTGDAIRVEAQLQDDNFVDKETGDKTNGRLKLGGNVSLEVLKYKNPKPVSATLVEDTQAEDHTEESAA